MQKQLRLNGSIMKNKFAVFACVMGLMLVLSEASLGRPDGGDPPVDSRSTRVGCAEKSAETEAAGRGEPSRRARLNSDQPSGERYLRGCYVSRRGEGSRNFPEAEKVRNKYKPQVLKIKASMKELRGSMSKELSSGNPRKDVIKGYINQMIELRRKEQLLLVDQMFETMEALPKEKRADYLQPIIEHCLR